MKITRFDSEARIVLHAGSGDRRSHYAVAGNSQPLVDWLLRCHAPAETDELARALSTATQVSQADASQLVENLIATQVLLPDGTHTDERDHLAKWGAFGWRDAADYHLATFGLRFTPDEVDGVTYADYFTQMVEDTESAGEQPPVVIGRDGALVPEPEVTRHGAVPTLDAVLGLAEPINRFEGRPVAYADFLPPLRAAFGVQRTVGGLLGPHHLRSYPSGGARHPFEAYVISKGIDDLPVGAYYFDPVAGQLIELPEQDGAHQIDAACFGKGGIRTASAVIVVTCRWLRHSWKYRYARSYRMLMLEIGHIVQAVNLSMISRGLNVYHCPAINDRLLRDILSIDDDCAEGPVYALGLGYGGVR